MLPKVGALLVGEPTGNVPLIGHKGALWLKAAFKGVTAHGSMPELGDNAVLKAARGAVRLHDHRFDTDKHHHLGGPSINIGSLHGGIASGQHVPVARVQTGEPFGRSGDPVERSPEVRQFDHRDHEARDPEDVHVREERDEAENRNELGLHLVGLVGDVFGQRVQAEEEDAEPEHGESQNDGRDDHEHVRFTGRGHKARQMFGRCGVNCCLSHGGSPNRCDQTVQRPAAETGLRACWPFRARQRLAPGRASSAQYSRCKFDLASAERSSAIDQEICRTG